MLPGPVMNDGMLIDKDLFDSILKPYKVKPQEEDHLIKMQACQDWSMVALGVPSFGKIELKPNDVVVYDLEDGSIIDIYRFDTTEQAEHFVRAKSELEWCNYRYEAGNK